MPAINSFILSYGNGNKTRLALAHIHAQLYSGSLAQPQADACIQQLADKIAVAYGHSHPEGAIWHCRSHTYAQRHALQEPLAQG